MLKVKVVCPQSAELSSGGHAGATAAEWQAIDAISQDPKQHQAVMPGFQLDWAARLDDQAALSATHL